MIPYIRFLAACTLLVACGSTPPTPGGTTPASSAPHDPAWTEGDGDIPPADEPPPEPAAGDIEVPPAP